MNTSRCCPAISEFIHAHGAVDGLHVQQIRLRSEAGGACMILEGASVEEVASKLATLPLVHEGFLQPPRIVPLKPYSGFASAYQSSPTQTGSSADEG
jgi:hypothetical protein